MRKNNKGFMLVEVIITSVVVATSMIGLYSTFNKLYNLYNKNISYYNVDSIYAIKTSLNYLFDNGFTDIINNNLNTNNYKVLIDNTPGSQTCFNDVVTCNEIKGTYKINKLIIVKCNKTTLESLKTTSINQTFKDYIDYVINYYNITNSDSRFSYIVLSEIDARQNTGELKKEIYYYGNMLLDNSSGLTEVA